MNTTKFVIESNMIEGIDRLPTGEELVEHDRFMELGHVTVSELERFLSVYQTNARIRSWPGMNVRVGRHIPPFGGPGVVVRLENLLCGIDDMTPFEAHIEYEKIHPFTDGNGRSGRALWAWHMGQLGHPISLPFLHHFYYQSLDDQRETLAAGDLSDHD